MNLPQTHESIQIFIDTFDEYFMCVARNILKFHRHCYGTDYHRKLQDTNYARIFLRDHKNI